MRLSSSLTLVHKFSPVIWLVGLGFWFWFVILHDASLMAQFSDT